VILVATSEKPFQQAAEYVRPRGTVVAIGLPAGAQLKAPVFESVLKMVSLYTHIDLRTLPEDYADQYFSRSASSVHTSATAETAQRRSISTDAAASPPHSRLSASASSRRSMTLCRRDRSPVDTCSTQASDAEGVMCLAKNKCNRQ